MPGKRNIFLYYWLPVIIYCALIFFQSSRPVPESVPSFPFSDKLLHGGIYAFLGALFFRAYNTTRLRDKAYRVALFSILSATLYGISDEWHQYFVPFRSADVMDAFADFSGSLCAAYVCLRLFKRNYPANGKL